jgi:hypothetical protein
VALPEDFAVQGLMKSARAHGLMAYEICRLNLITGEAVSSTQYLRHVKNNPTTKMSELKVIHTPFFLTTL